MVVQRNHLERCFYVGDTHMDEEAAGAARIPLYTRHMVLAGQSGRLAPSSH